MNHKGTPLMILGLFFIAAAALMLFGNRGIDSAAQEAVQDAAIDLLQAIEENAVSVSLSEEDKLISADVIPETPDIEASQTISVNNVAYIGLLDIPVLSLTLPIQAECSTAALRDAPCRYYGSINTGDLVIAGHNYNAHFGYLHNLSIGDTVHLKSADGSLHTYIVHDIEIISPYDVSEMCAGDWPLTLFTCTYGGQNRVAIRCSITD